jgi:hypothetical protein
MLRDDVKARETPGEMDRSYLIPHVAKSRALGDTRCLGGCVVELPPSGIPIAWARRHRGQRNRALIIEIVPSRAFDEKGVSTGKSHQLGKLVWIIQR